MKMTTMKMKEVYAAAFLLLDFAFECDDGMMTTTTNRLRKRMDRKTMTGKRKTFVGIWMVMVFAI